VPKRESVIYVPLVLPKRKRRRYYCEEVSRLPTLLGDLSILRLNSLERGGIGRCMPSSIFPVVASKESSRAWESVVKVALAETV
jgi:hypothetical protein